LVTIFTAFNEGYLAFNKEQLSFTFILFWIGVIAGFLISFCLALGISTKRLFSLILGIFIIEYFKETIGIRSGMWTYNGFNGFYNFGVWLWVLASLVAYMLFIKIIIPLLGKIKLSIPKWLNLVLVIALFVIIFVTLGKYQSGAGILFWSFYIILLIAGIYVALRTESPVFILGVILASWIIGNPSEYLGSMGAGIWTYAYNPNYPPVFLLFGCWPLEILSQYSLSAFLSGEPLV
jgi:hypothetical protein